MTPWNHSFQVASVVYTVIVAKQGTMTGRMIRIRICMGLAPSIMAASSISAGRLRMKFISSST